MEDSRSLALCPGPAHGKGAAAWSEDDLLAVGLGPTIVILVRIGRCYSFLEHFCRRHDISPLALNLLRILLCRTLLCCKDRASSPCCLSRAIHVWTQPPPTALQVGVWRLPGSRNCLLCCILQPCEESFYRLHFATDANRTVRRIENVSLASRPTWLKYTTPSQRDKVLYHGGRRQL